MDNAAKPLLVTSLNPASNLEYQMECFDQWNAIGFETRTVNVDEEAKKLRASGLTADRISIIDPRDSGASLFAKPVPRIKPLLESLASEASHDFYVITNSDIYPAVRSASVVSFWQKTAEALALTREECIDLDGHGFADHNPYHGGLDTFFMTKNSLRLISEKLAKIPAAERMAFGVPGWDYMIGACMLTPEVGGHFADSRCLLHVSHRQSYADIQEFKHYIPAISHMGITTASGVAEAAQQFSERIHMECIKHESESRMARLICFSPPAMSRNQSEPMNSVDQIMGQLSSLLPRLEEQYRVSVIRSLVVHFTTRNGGLQPVLHAMLDSRSRLFQFSQALFVIALALHCKRSVTGFNISETYPRGNRHAAALKNILSRESPSAGALRVEIASLFGIELIDYRILNRRLFDYLALSCANSSERHLLAEIKHLALEGEHAT